MSKISKFFFGNKDVNILNGKQKANVVGGKTTTNSTSNPPIDSDDTSVNGNNTNGSGS